MSANEFDSIYDRSKLPDDFSERMKHAEWYSFQVSKDERQVVDDQKRLDDQRLEVAHRRRLADEALGELDQMLAKARRSPVTVLGLPEDQ